MSVIAIDLDGPCYEWDKTARYMLRKYRSCAYLTEPSTSWEGVEAMIPKADWNWLWTKGVELGLFRYGHMVRDCRFGLEALVQAKHKLIIVTARPTQATNDTLDWVSLYFKGIPLEGFYMSSVNAKSVVPFDVLIDDKPANIEDAVGHARRGLLFDTPENQGETSGRRVIGWAGVVDELCSSKPGRIR